MLKDRKSTSASSIFSDHKVSFNGKQSDEDMLFV